MTLLWKSVNLNPHMLFPTFGALDITGLIYIYSYKIIDHIKQLISIDTYYIVLSVQLFPPKSVSTPAPGLRQFSSQLVSETL